jgi:hypothetical protein
MWIVEYMAEGWDHEPRDGYVVYHSDADKQKTGYAYMPCSNGKAKAEKFAKLCNDVGEKEACRVMGYKEPSWSFE